MTRHTFAGHRLDTASPSPAGVGPTSSPILLRISASSAVGAQLGLARPQGHADSESVI